MNVRKAFWWERAERRMLARSRDGLYAERWYGLRFDQDCRRCLVEGSLAPRHLCELFTLRVLIVWGDSERVIWTRKTIPVRHGERILASDFPEDDYPQWSSDRPSTVPRSSLDITHRND